MGRPNSAGDLVPDHFGWYAWLQEFIRVESDRVLLFALILILLHHDPTGDLKVVIGALIGLIQGNRWARSPGGK